jgi:hypothetical protein
MFRVLVGALGALALAWPVAAQVKPFPGDFRTQEIKTDDGATIHLRAGGHGPVVVLLHGFGDTGDMWVPLASAALRFIDAVEWACERPAAMPEIGPMRQFRHPRLECPLIF